MEHLLYWGERRGRGRGKGEGGRGRGEKREGNEFLINHKHLVFDLLVYNIHIICFSSQCSTRSNQNKNLINMRTNHFWIPLILKNEK